VIHVRQKLDTTERRTCTVIGLARSTLQYRSTPKDDEALRLALIRLAKSYGRYGYRKIAKLQMEFPVLKKRYWGRHFWGRGYFSTTTGAITDDIVFQYLENHIENPTDASR